MTLSDLTGGGDDWTKNHDLHGALIVGIVAAIIAAIIVWIAVVSVIPIAVVPTILTCGAVMFILVLKSLIG
jgi:hypothetical protein